MQFSQAINNTTECQFSPNSELFAYVYEQKFYIKQNIIDLKNYNILSAQGSSNGNQKINISSNFKFSPDSKYIAFLNLNKHSIQICSIQGQLIATISENQNQIAGMTWTPDSNSLLVFSPYQTYCGIYNLTDGNIAYIKKNKAINQQGFVFFGQGKFMAMLERHESKDTIGIYCTKTWQMMNHIAIQTYDSAKIIATQSGNLVVVDNIISFKVLFVHPFYGSIPFYVHPYDYGLGVSSIQISKNDMFLAIGSYDQKVRLYNILTWKLITQFDCSQNISIDTSKTVVYKDQMNMNQTQLKRIQKIGFFNINAKLTTNDKEINSKISQIKISPKSQYLVCKNDSSSNVLFIWSLQTLQLHTVLSLTKSVKSFIWNSNQNSLMIVYGENNIIFWNQEDGDVYEIQFFPKDKNFAIQKIKLSPNQKSLFIISKNKKTTLAEFTN